MVLSQCRCYGRGPVVEPKRLSDANGFVLGLARLRVGIFVLALLLGVHAAWTLAAELVRPARPDFPAAGAHAAAAEHDLDRAVAAAKLAAVRGELWADAAILQAGGVQDDIEAGRTGEAPAALTDARAMAERAARLSPHDSRLWLLIAAIDARLDWLDGRVGAPLKMSYYTAPNDGALMGLRLLIATRSEAIADPDLQVLVSGEVRTIVRNRPDLKGAILAAHRAAPPQGREFIEGTLRDFAPDLLAATGARGGRP